MGGALWLSAWATDACLEDWRWVLGTAEASSTMIAWGVEMAETGRTLLLTLIWISQSAGTGTAQDRHGGRETGKEAGESEIVRPPPATATLEEAIGPYKKNAQDREEFPPLIGGGGHRQEWQDHGQWHYRHRRGRPDHRKQAAEGVNEERARTSKTKKNAET